VTIKKAAPPGWEPHKVAARTDGWVGNPDFIPPGVARMIVQAMPSPLGADSVADIRARMQARQLMHERKRKRQRMVERMGRWR
jgi:hypothetical protein